MTRVLAVAVGMVIAGGLGWFFFSGGAAAQSEATTPIRTIRAGQTVSFTAPLPSSTDRLLCDIADDDIPAPQGLEGSSWNASEQRCYFGGNLYRSTSYLGPYRHTWGNDHVSEIEVTNGGSGYCTATVTISGDGQGATATAVLTSGAISSITMNDHGIGYTHSASAATERAPLRVPWWTHPPSRA